MAIGSILTVKEANNRLRMFAKDLGLHVFFDNENVIPYTATRVIFFKTLDKDTLKRLCSITMDYNNITKENVYAVMLNVIEHLTMSVEISYKKKRLTEINEEIGKLIDEADRMMRSLES